MSRLREDTQKNDLHSPNIRRSRGRERSRYQEKTRQRVCGTVFLVRLCDMLTPVRDQV